MRQNFFLGIVCAVVGLIMLFVPQDFIKAVVVSLGVVAIVNGVYILTTSRFLVDTAVYNKLYTIRALLSLGIGLLAVVLPLAVAGTLWLIMSYILGGYLLISSAISLYGVMVMKNIGLSIKPYLYEVAVSVLIALVLLFVPHKAGVMLIRLCGLLILLGGAGLILRSVIISRTKS